MTPRDMEKLLGGYATNTLTAEERTALFDAALGNQALFDALADEQALKELLDDPSCRRQLLNVLEEKPRASWLERFMAWAWQPPMIAAASAVAVGVIVIASVKLIPRMTERQQVVMTTAQKPIEDQQAQPAASAPAPNPAPQTSAAPEEKPAERREPAKAKQEAPPQPEVAMARNQALPAAPAPAAAVPPGAAMPAPPPSPVQTADATQRNMPAIVTPSARDIYYSPQAELSTNAFAARPQTAMRGGVARAGSASMAAVKIPGVRYSIMKRGADEAFTETAPGSVFHAGDALRLRFEANQEGMVTVRQRDASGNWTTSLNARLRQGEPAYLPAEGALMLPQPGEIQLFVTFSREPQAGGRAEAVSATPNLQQSADHSTYVVNPKAGATAPVAFLITLRFQ